MKNDFKYIIHNTGDVSKKHPAKAIEMFPISRARDARKFHRQIPDYHMTPLVALPNLAHLLGVGGIYVKNEAERLHMNSFKVMGGSYAIYRLVRQLLGKEDEDLTFDYLTSKECHEALGNITFCSATDGNHGRGLAWACQKLDHPCKIYVHSETSQARINAIKGFGADVTVVDGNYDDAVRQAAADAKKNGWYVVSDTSWPGYEEIPTWIMQGYNSIMLEAQEQFSGMGIVKPTHVFVQAGVPLCSSSLSRTRRPASTSPSPPATASATASRAISTPSWRVSPAAIPRRSRSTSCVTTPTSSYRCRTTSRRAACASSAARSTAIRWSSAARAARCRSALSSPSARTRSRPT